MRQANWDSRTLTIEPDVEVALGRAVQATSIGSCLSVVPSYSAMLHLRQLLAGLSG
jgi:hypothetical protein